MSQTCELEGTVFHLTLTGYYAGRPLCDCNKEEEKAKGARFFHAMYAPECVLQSERLCQKCKDLWMDS